MPPLWSLSLSAAPTDESTAELLQTRLPWGWGNCIYTPEDAGDVCVCARASWRVLAFRGIIFGLTAPHTLWQQPLSRRWEIGSLARCATHVQWTRREESVFLYRCNACLCIEEYEGGGGWCWAVGWWWGVFRYLSGGILDPSFVWNPASLSQSVASWKRLGVPIWTRCVFRRAKRV